MLHQKKSQEPMISRKKRTSFFKIINSSIIHGRQLGIPNRFIQKQGKSLPYVVDLKVPTGSLSRVELKKVDGILWFQKGWQEFMEQYSIDVGHFLVFKYDGKSQFHVLIFDMSGNEIPYCNDSNCAGESGQVPRKESTKRKEIVDIPSHKHIYQTLILCCCFHIMLWISNRVN